MTDRTTSERAGAVAFIGLGNMGAPMAERLLVAGHRIKVYDVDEAARQRLAEKGAAAASDLGDVVSDARVVLLMLADSRVVETVLTDPALRDALSANSVVVDMSSSEPLTTQTLATDLAEIGVRLMDAPVSGGVSRAEAGTLTIMAGGEEETLHLLTPLLQHLGEVTHVGGVGAGHAMKAINNLLSATHLLATSEAIHAGRQFGLDPQTMLAVFNSSSGRSGSTENKWPNFILPGTYDSGFGLRLMLKDIRIAVALADQVGSTMRLAPTAVELWAEAAHALDADADHTEIARWVGRKRRSPVTRRPCRPDNRTSIKGSHELALTEQQKQAKENFIKIRSTWGETWQAVLELDPEFLRSYAEFSGVPWRKNHLDDKTKELIYIAVDANATHMYLPGVRQHIRAALKLGATPEEIMEVLELTATLGIHAMNIGVPILVEVLAEKGLRKGPVPLSDYQERVKKDFTETRGYWHSFWDEILELDPEMFAAYTDFSSVPWRHGALEAKVKELVYIAFDTAATHLYVKGLKLHIENAVGYGATTEEILEVMEIASVLGIHAVTEGAPILRQEIENHQSGGGSTS